MKLIINANKEDIDKFLNIIKDGKNLNLNLNDPKIANLLKTLDKRFIESLKSGKRINVRKPDDDELLNYLCSALKISKKNKNNLLNLNLLKQIGFIKLKKESLEEALEIYNEALIISIEINDINSSRDILNKLGAIYSELGDFESSFKFLEMEKNFANKIGNKIDIISNLNNLGIVKVLQDKMKEAGYYFLDALKILNTIDEKEIQNFDKRQLKSYKEVKAETFHGLGRIYKFSEKYDNALKYYFQCYKIYKDLKDQNSMVTILNNISNIFFIQKNYDKGIKILQEIIDKNYTKEPSKLSIIYDNIANYYWKIGDYQLAKENYINSIKIVENLIEEIKSEDFRILLRISKIHPYESLILMLLEWYEKIKNEELLFESLYYLEIIKSREILKNFQSYKYTIPFDQLGEILRERNAIIWEFLSFSNIQNYEKNFKIITWDGYRIKIFITKEFNKEKLIDKMSEFQINIKAPFVQFSEIRILEIANEIQEIFPDDLISTLANKDDLIIIPHNELHSIPWEINRELNSRIPISRSYSLSLFYNSIERKQFIRQFKYILVITNPNYNIDNLEFSEKELEYITNLLKDMDINIKILRREQATKANFLKEINNNYNIIHFSGHGYYTDENDPWSNGIAFYDPTSLDILKVKEVVNLKLINNPICILSACETARSITISKIDELIGIIRGFIIAGASSIIACNWIIGEKIALNFAIFLYKYLLEGFSLSKSLFKIRQDLKRMYDSPLHWGVFSIYGNPFLKFSIEKHF